MFNKTKQSNYDTLFSHQGTPVVRRERAWLEDRIEKGRVRMFMEEVNITPSLAELMLEFNEKNNRPISESATMKYAADMRAGNWLKTSKGISFSEDGRLIDGQHRLAAVSLVGRDIQMCVVFGESRDAFAVIDTGKRRTAGDVLKIAGGKNTNVVAAAASILIRIERETYSRGRTGHVTNSDIIAFTARNQDLEEMAREAMGTQRKIKLKTGVALAAYFLLSSSRNNYRLPEFWGMLSEGQGLDKKNPIYHLRERLITKRLEDTLRSKNTALRNVILVATIITVWNKWVNGRTAGSCPAWDSQNPFPRVQ